MNNLINSITSTFKKLAGGSCWKVILLVAILVAAGVFIYYKFFYNKAEQYADGDIFDEEDDVEDFEDDIDDDDDDDIDDDDDEDDDDEDDDHDDDDYDEDFAGIGDMNDEEMRNLGKL